MRKTVLTAVAAMAFAIPAGALADDGGISQGAAASPSNSATATNGGSNSSTQIVGISQTSSAYSQVVVTGGAGGSGSNASVNEPNASGTSGGNTSGDAGKADDPSSNSGGNGNAAGQEGTGNGGSGGDGGGVAATVSGSVSSSNVADVVQVNKQKIVVLAPAIQEASADFSQFALGLTFGSGHHH